MKKVLVIVGAGASFDVWDRRSASIRNEEWRPPIAKNLFDLSKKNYRGLAIQHNGVQMLDDKLQPDSGDIEQELRDCATHGDSEIRRWFRDVPPYLHDLLRKSSDEYIDRPQNYQALIRRIRNEFGFHVAFVSLNYDTLLEKAASQFKYRLESISDYVHPQAARFGPFVKLHGSIDWYMRIPKNLSLPEKEKWHEALDRFDPIDHASKNTVEILHFSDVEKGAHPTMKNLRSESGAFVYPVLTAPLAGKASDHRVCPEDHLQALERWVKDCTRVLCVGVSGRDKNLFSLVTNHLPGNDLRASFVCGDGTQDAIGRFMKGCSQITNATISAHPTSFSKYIRAPALLDNFLRA